MAADLRGERRKWVAANQGATLEGRALPPASIIFQLGK